MDKRETIKDYIIKNRPIKEFMGKVPSDIRGDFQSHIWCIILEMEPDKLIRLYDEGILGKYIMGIMMIQLKMTNSTFNQTYRIKTIETDMTQMVQEETEEEDVQMDIIKWKRITETINRVRPMDSVLFRMYYGIDDDNNLVEPKTYGEIQKITGLKYHTIRKSILRTKSKI
jgi:hypothetical protein